MAAADLARATSSDFVQLRCETPAAVAADRIRRRLARGGGPSDATPEVAAAMALRFDPWADAVRVDTAASRRGAVVAALAAVGSSTDP